MYKVKHHIFRRGLAMLNSYSMFFGHLESSRKTKLKLTASTSYKVCVDKTASILRKNLYDKLPRNPN